MLEFALAENFSPDTVTGDGVVWLEALPARLYHTPLYGKVPVTTDKLERMVQNFKSNVRGQEIAVNFDHGMDRAKGNQAAGWYKDFAVKPSSSDPSQPSLYAAVQFTTDAAKEIQDGKWKYFSLEWDDLWTANDGTKHKDVIVGGAVTNRPVAKHMQALPVNFSENQWVELDDETKKEFAVWSTAFVNNLPDSAFLYIQPGGTKDSEGKTVPRDNRHFPYKGTDGKIDLPHLRNAIARIPQAGNWLSAEVKARLQARARSLLNAASRNMSEEVLELLDEVVEWEHSEPGTGPAPAATPPDPAIEEEWRRDPLPLPLTDPNAPKPDSKGDTALTPEELAELRKKLQLSENATAAEIIAAAGKAFSESVAMREAVSAASEEKTFAEQFPAMHKRMIETENINRTNAAKTFSESVSKVSRQDGDKKVDTNMGLSAAAVDKVQEVHKKFAEGTGTVTDFEEVLTTVTQGGLVKFGEEGSGTLPPEAPVVDITNAQGIANARKEFAEKVTELMTSDSLEYMPALQLAAKKFPQLAEAAMAAPVG